MILKIPNETFLRITRYFFHFNPFFLGSLTDVEKLYKYTRLKILFSIKCFYWKTRISFFYKSKLPHSKDQNFLLPRGYVARASWVPLYQNTFFSHFEHSWVFSLSALCVFKCCFKISLLFNPLPHSWHISVFSPWTRQCAKRSTLPLKLL